ncbi:MAG TPA: PIN domain nuclease [Ramlibacter sp.]|uniref:type II toxin-antitoxin system VapC family toxin n=1 Tax=Ramlibacter sp. TaxID=1917967 RepID=UPI002CCAA1DD|nr:PIN domain nuclease [Ramlibacter sp.]HVZ43975.1 PIN domain nuclease [Ramlibacter sp.]
MLLVDSSVWIQVERGIATEATRFLDNRDEIDELATTGIICQEVLQGVRSDALFETLRERFWSMLVLEPRELTTYELAAGLYRSAREKGFTIRKPNDCLIAALALEHGALLVHNDRDFIALAHVEPSLLIYPGRPH